MPEISCDALDCKWNVRRRCTAEKVEIADNEYDYDAIVNECITFER